MSARGGLAGLDRVGARNSSAPTSTRSAATRPRRSRTSPPRPWARCRGRTSIREREQLYAAFNYPGVVAHVGAISLDDGPVEKLARSRARRIYFVTSLACDPDARTLFYTDRQRRLARPASRWTRRPASRELLMRDARIGDLVVRPADRSLWGMRHFNGICDARAHPAALHGVEAGPLVAVRGGRLRPRRLARRHAALGVVGEISGRQTLRVMRRRRAARGRRDADRARSTSARSIPSNFVFSPGRALPLRQLLLHGRLEHLPLRPRRGNARRGQQHARRASSARCRWAADSLHRLPLLGRGVRRRPSSRPKPLEDVSAITFLGERDRREAPGRQGLERRLARGRSRSTR